MSLRLRMTVTFDVERPEGDIEEAAHAVFDQLRGCGMYPDSANVVNFDASLNAKKTRRPWGVPQAEAKVAP